MISVDATEEYGYALLILYDYGEIRVEYYSDRPDLLVDRIGVLSNKERKAQRISAYALCKWDGIWSIETLVGYTREDSKTLRDYICNEWDKRSN